MATPQTKVFATLSALSALPSVTLLATLAIDPDFPIAFYTGIAFTHSALVCVAAIVATAISAVCDLFD